LLGSFGPTGLFILETKNWSKQSIKNEDLFSPVQQVKRAAFALFVYLMSDERTTAEQLGKIIKLLETAMDLNRRSEVRFLGYADHV
jgi:hypothetical protein